MSEHDVARFPEASPPEDRFSEGGLRAPAHYGALRKIWWWFDFVVLVKLARLRFIAILAAIGAVIVYWETLHAYYEKWTRPVFGQEQAVSADTEFWCPMHPTIVREKPDKCPLCAMPLSRRKKGEKQEGEALPPGILSRVQLTPYRVAQAGVQTVELTYQPLAKEIKAVGFVEFDERKLARIAVRPTGKSRIDKLFVNVTGQKVEKGEPLAYLYNPDLVATVQNLLKARADRNRDLERLARDRLQLWGIEPDQIEHVMHQTSGMTHLLIRSPISGYVIRKYQQEGEYLEEGSRLYDVADLSVVWIEAQIYEDDLAFLKLGQPVSATTTAYPARKFTGTVAFIDPNLDRSSRTIRVRFDLENPNNELRPGMYATVTLAVAAGELPLLAEATSPLPLSPGVDAPSSLSPGGRGVGGERDSRFLALPERALIDTGSRKIVYREYLPQEYEGVLVELGPRMVGPDGGLYYPVVRGLQAGDRVVTSGSFLIDAETRLTAGASSTYFGASGGPQGTERPSAITAGTALVEDEDAKVKAALGKLSTPDRRLAESQGWCPVLRDNRLGVMGVPAKVLVLGRWVFLCCVGCKEKALANLDQTLREVEQRKPRASSTPLPRGERSRSETREGLLSPLPGVRPSLTAAEAAEIKAALTRLNPEDRRLAETQVFCAVTPNSYLGSMGVPIKVTIKGQPVFLCCASCQEKALANPEQTLNRVRELKAQNAVPPR